MKDKVKVVKPKIVKASSKASVVVFDEAKYGLSRLKSLEGRGFKRRPKEKDDESEEDPDMPTARPNSNDPDDIADMEVSQLWERLKDTVEDIATSDLKGKDRRSHLLCKAARLSGQEVKKPVAPFRHRMGMQKKQTEREKKAREAAREMDGVVLASSGKKKVNTRGVRHRR